MVKPQIWCYTFIAIVIVIYFCYTTRQEFQLKSFEFVTAMNKNPIIQSDNYVILSANTNNRYLFTLPIALAAWNKLGIPGIILCAGTEESFRANPNANLMLNFLIKMNASFFFLQNQKVSPTSLSQVARLYAAAMPFSNDLDPDTVFITSDADLVPFHREHHVLPNGSKIHSYTPDCCGRTRMPEMRGEKEIKMFSMITMTMSIRTWREVMNITTANYTASDIEADMISNFGSNFFHPEDETLPDLIGSRVWYADQALMSYNLKLWFEKTHISYTRARTREFSARRIDRAWWPYDSKVFKSYSLNDWDDAHLPTDCFSDKTWPSIKAFIKFVFPGRKNLHQMFDEYRKAFVAIML